MAKVIALPAPKPRISPKLRAAVDLMVRENRTQGEAAAQAGMSRQGLSKALKRPAVRDLLQEARIKLAGDADALRTHVRIEALKVALDLMKNSKDERIRARMAEFLSADARVSPVAVNIDARRVENSGYVYHRPDAING